MNDAASSGRLRELIHKLDAGENEPANQPCEESDPDDGEVEACEGNSDIAGASSISTPSTASYIRHFFDSSSYKEHHKCLLHPEPVNNQAVRVKHKVLLSKKGDITNLKRHLNSAHHQQAKALFDSLKDQGLSNESAARRTLELAEEKCRKRKLSFARGTYCYNTCSLHIKLSCSLRRYEW